MREQGFRVNFDKIYKTQQEFLDSEEPSLNSTDDERDEQSKDLVEKVMNRDQNLMIEEINDEDDTERE